MEGRCRKRLKELDCAEDDKCVVRDGLTTLRGEADGPGGVCRAVERIGSPVLVAWNQAAVSRPARWQEGGVLREDVSQAEKLEEEEEEEYDGGAAGVETTGRGGSARRS